MSRIFKGALTLCLLVSLLAVSSEGWADCNPRDFMLKDITALQQSGEAELAFVLTASPEEFSSVRKSVNGHSLYGLFDSDFNSALERARQIAQATKFDYKSSYATSYLYQSLPPSALDAYAKCLEAEKTPGLKVWLENRQGDYLTFGVIWNTPDLSQGTAKFDVDPFIDGGDKVSQPPILINGKPEAIVVKRTGNNDLFLRLKVGGQTATQVIVKDPPIIAFRSSQVISPRIIKAFSSGPNPGCSAGVATDCISPIHPGGTFVPKSAAMTEFTSTSPGTYSEKFRESPDQVCVVITQSTGACEVHNVASGRLSATEKYPQASD